MKSIPSSCISSFDVHCCFLLEAIFFIFFPEFSFQFRLHFEDDDVLFKSMFDCHVKQAKVQNLFNANELASYFV